MGLSHVRMVLQRISIGQTQRVRTRGAACAYSMSGNTSSEQYEISSRLPVYAFSVVRISNNLRQITQVKSVWLVADCTCYISELCVFEPDEFLNLTFCCIFSCLYRFRMEVIFLFLIRTDSAPICTAHEALKV